MKFFLRKLLVGVYLAQLIVGPIRGEQPSDNSGHAATVDDVQVVGDSVTLKLSQLMPYDVFTLDSPSRLVIEIPETRYKAGFSKKNINTNLISRLRGYQFKENPLISRVILDLKSPVDYKANANGSEVTITLQKNEVADQLSQKEAVEKKVTAAPKKDSRTDLLRSLPKEVVTLDFESADIKDVIRLMAETSNINIIFGPEVSGSITIHLKQVPFDEAFRTIMNLKGFVASQLGSNILRVTTPDLLSKERTKAVLYTKSIPVNYLKAADMATHIQSVMASSGRKGTITVEQASNSLVVTDSEEGIQQTEILIAQLDKRPKQVMIESRIVEINLNNGFDIGVQWEYSKYDIKTDKTQYFGTQNLGGGARVHHTGSALTNYGYAAADDVGANGPGQNGTGVNLAGPTAAGITFGFIKNQQLLSATLGALISQSRAKILSAPKIVTVNGELAKIEAVQDIPFETATIAANGAISRSFRTVSAGIILTVTPIINAENRITLKIKPESSFPTQESVGILPIIRTRNAQTTVIVKDGDTLVIGGLIDDQDTKGVQKVPLLGDIPIIGAFFRSNTSRKIRNELLIFVTPRIIRD